MLLSEDARATRKTAQLARLARKTDPDYPTIYASQPGEIQKGAEQGAERKLARALKNQASTAAISDAEAAANIFTSGSLETGNAGSDSE